MTSSSEPDRRRILLGAAGAALGAALPLSGARAQELATTAEAQPDSAEADRIAAEFLGGVAPQASGLKLEAPETADNPAAVPLHVVVTEPLAEDLWCEELIVIAERNPLPLACRYRFSAATGAAEVALRVRLIQSMEIRALARLSDGRVLEARAAVESGVGGCGM
ncbi:thiosulfate oxidation carrier protein SoxY [Neomegalonema perideroedes]|uniref:thiosulfate oxidation carrier protein SoxY n=1 Tax=Neomegalonema perideroedes TaxID=217219 RepID=UPI00036A7444|nr:thiosulfate oxidation carrier protein SoxY [Neomegalonema perideroedes]